MVVAVGGSGRQPEAEVGEGPVEGHSGMAVEEQRRAAAARTEWQMSQPGSYPVPDVSAGIGAWGSWWPGR